MRLSDLSYSYPESLVACEKLQPSRVMCVQNQAPSEISLEELIASFEPGDLLVLNNTRVLKRRVFSEDGLEVLFLQQLGETDWEVLFPASRIKADQIVHLAGGLDMQLLEKGLPQTVRLSRPVDENYFNQFGELPLPPYIQKARKARHTLASDNDSYQTRWASRPGSFAAPTASLHFDNHHLQSLKKQGVAVTEITLHVGLGTFLPVKVDNLDEHVMHPEWIEIPASSWELVTATRERKKRVWALGTTVTRALESCAQGRFEADAQGHYTGWSDLFIKDDFEFRAVNVLMTNFHQPQSTLLALVSAFAGLDTVLHSYEWAMERKFRLFSYGDLTVWHK